MLGWSKLPPPVGGPPDLPLHRSPPPGIDWAAASTRDLRRVTADLVPSSFHPSARALAQCAGPLEPETGILGRAATVLVRRTEGATTLRVTQS